MPRRSSLLRIVSIALILLAALSACGAFLPTITPRATLTPRPRQAPVDSATRTGHWTKGNKLAVGTAYTVAPPGQVNPSRVWFTVTEGALTDAFYPTLDRPNLREFVFIVVGPGAVWRETSDLNSTLRRPDPWALLWEIESTDPEGQFRLVKSIVADPQGDALLVGVRLEVLKGQPSEFALFGHLVPQIGGTGRANSVSLSFAESRAILVGEGAAVQLASDVPWLAATASYEGGQAGLADLLANGRLTMQFDEASRSDYPTLTIQFPVDKTITLALGFGADASQSAVQAQRALGRGLNAARLDYVSGWRNYCASLNLVEGENASQYYLSAMLLRASLDKTYPGATVAAFSVPWGDRVLDRPGEMTPLRDYRRVWPHDAVQTALGLWAAGDEGSARSILSFLDEVQQIDGGWASSSHLEGTPAQSGDSVDQAAHILLLAWRLDAIERYMSLIKPAADYLVAKGPRTSLDRWQENAGYAPASLAAQIAGLVVASDFAQRVGDAGAARTYRLFADRWAMELQVWTLARSGPLGQNYLLRIAPEARPEAADPVSLAFGGNAVDQRTLVDPSFLELVRLGIYPPNDPIILSTLAVIDKALRVETSRGPAWYRYPGDLYGEPSRGGSAPGKGHPWTILTAERAMYELAADRPAQARALRQALERFANPGGMFSEQVWEDSGEATGSVAPRFWVHSEYIRLVNSLQRGQVIDLPQVVVDHFRH